MNYPAYVQFTNENNVFTIENGIRLTEMGPDYAVSELVIEHRHLNLLGYLQGGVYFTMADAACGAAARSNGCTWITLNSSFSFHHGVSSGTLRADARVRQRSRKICTCEATVIDGEGRLAASGTFTFYCVSLEGPGGGFNS